MPHDANEPPTTNPHGSPLPALFCARVCDRYNSVTFHNKDNDTIVDDAAERAKANLQRCVVGNVDDVEGTRELLRSVACTCACVWHGTLSLSVASAGTFASCMLAQLLHCSAPCCALVYSHYMPWLADALATESAASKRALQAAKTPALPRATETAIREHFAIELQLHDFAVDLHQRQLEHVRALRRASAAASTSSSSPASSSSDATSTSGSTSISTSTQH